MDSLARSYRYQSRRSFVLERRDTARRASAIARTPEVERLLGEPRLGDDTDGKKFRVKGRMQRMAENGEALKYVELVLRQLRRASRDHRHLVEQRHRLDVPRRKSWTTRGHPSGGTDWSFAIPGGQSGREEEWIVRDSWEKPRKVSREVRAMEGPQELAEFSGSGAAAKLLAKRKTYAVGGVKVLETVPKRIHDRMSTGGRPDLRYVSAYEGIDAAIIR